MKTKNKLILYFLLLAFCFANRLSALQLIQLPFQAVIDSSTVIIEGTVIADSSFMGSDSNIYTANTVEISKILKNGGIHTVSCGRVEIITLGGTIKTVLSIRRSYIPGNLTFAVGEVGIFMCIPTTRPSLDLSLENSNIFEVYANVQGFVLENQISETNTQCLWYWYQLPNLDSLYTYIHHLTGYTYETCSYKRGSHKMQSNDSIVNFSFANEYIKPGTLYNTLEFDIMVSSSDPGTYLSSCVFGIKYNTIPFGSWISTNHNVVVSNAGSFDSTSYDATFYPDHFSDEFTIDIVASGTGGGTVELGSPQKLCHVSMTITTPCNNTADLSIDYYIHGDDKFDDNNSNPPDTTYYYYAGSTDTYDGNLCINAHIEDFTPTTIAGGTQELLTIHGTGFGSTRGNKTVYFTNSGNNNFLVDAPADSFFIHSWSDTEVEVYVPCQDENPVVLKKNQGIPIAATGDIAIGTDASKLTSTQTLKIKYSARNTMYEDDLNPAITPYWLDFLRGNNGSGGITFRLNSDDFGSGSGTSWEEIQCFKEALRDWTCETGDNMILGSTFTSKRANAYDGINSITLVNASVLGGGVLAGTVYNTATPCDNGSGYVRIYQSDVDIEILDLSNYSYNPEHSFLCPKGQYDFRSVVEHEFGHALGLEHTLNSGDMMLTQTPEGTIKTLSSDDIAGGSYETSEGEEAFSSYCNTSGSEAPMTNKSCYSYIKPDMTQDIFNIFPNPFVNEINFNFNVPLNESGNLIITNIEGKTVYLNPIYSPSFNSTLELGSLPSGIYILHFIYQGNSYTRKLTKL